MKELIIGLGIAIVGGTVAYLIGDYIKRFIDYRLSFEIDDYNMLLVESLGEPIPQFVINMSNIGRCDNEVFSFEIKGSVN